MWALKCVSFPPSGGTVLRAGTRISRLSLTIESTGTGIQTKVLKFRARETEESLAHSSRVSSDARRS